MAGAMGYLTDRRAQVRTDPKLLLPSARSIICVGKLYNAPQPRTTEVDEAERGWISRYAWGDDYHDVLRRGLEQLAAKLGPDHEYKICVDTAPLLERSYARQAGLGWIGKNTCLINQEIGSWIFLGEMLTSLETRERFSAARPLRHLHALHRSVSHPSHRSRRLCNRRPALHSLLHYRTARRGAGGIAGADRPAHLRVRYLPGCLPVEWARTGGRRTRVPASVFRAAVGRASHPDGGRLPVEVSRQPHPAR